MLMRKVSILTNPPSPSGDGVALVAGLGRMRPSPCHEVVERPYGQRSRHAWTFWSSSERAQRVPTCAGSRDVGKKPGLSYAHERDDPIGAPVPSKTSHRTATAPCSALCMGERYPNLNYSNRKWLELAASCRNRVVEDSDGVQSVSTHVYETCPN